MLGGDFSCEWGLDTIIFFMCRQRGRMPGCEFIQVLVIENVKLIRDKAARSFEWAEVTERAREAKSGGVLTARLVRQSRSLGL